MYPVSQNYKNAIYAPTRRVDARVTFDISDVTAYSDIASIVASTAFGNKTNLVSQLPSDWELGTISTVDGSNIAATTRVRTIGYITVTPNTRYWLRVFLNNNYWFSYAEYSNSGFIASSSTWVTNTSFVTSATTTRIRLIIRRGDDVTFTDSGIVASVFPEMGLVEAPFVSKLSQSADQIRRYTNNYATLETNRFRLDGSFSFPDANVNNNGEVGFTSGNVCGPDTSPNLIAPLYAITANFGGGVLLDDYSVRFFSSTGAFQFDSPVIPVTRNSVYTLSGAFTGRGYMELYGSTADGVINSGILIGTGIAYGNTSASANIGARDFVRVRFIKQSFATSIGGTIENAQLERASAKTTFFPMAKTFLNGYPQITYNFTGTHSSAGITITFDNINNEYATDYVMDAYNASGTLIASVPVTGNTQVVSAIETPFANYKKIVITIKKWSKGNRRARVLEVSFGIVKTYTDDNLVEMHLAEDLDVASGSLPSYELSFSIDNSDRAFNILNPTGFYKYLQQRQVITAEMGVDVGGLIEFVPLGLYYLNDWISEEGTLTAKFTANTVLDFMEGFPYSNSTATTKTLYQFAVDIFTLCGVPATGYSIDTALQTINTNCLVQATNCKAVIQMIALAGCANVYVNRSGVIQIKAYQTRRVRYIRDWLHGNTVNNANHWCEIQAFDASGTNVALGKTVTAQGMAGFTGNVNITDGSTATTLFGQGAPTDGVSACSVTVDLGAIYNIAKVSVWHYYGDVRTYKDTKTEGSENGVDWFPIFDSAVSGTYVETSSGKVTQLETCRMDGQTLSPDTIDMDNTYEEPRITLSQPTKQVEVKYFTSLGTAAGSSTATCLLAGQVLAVDGNTLINDATRAAAVANWLLGRLNNTRALYDINWRGNPAHEILDPVMIENSFGVDIAARIVKTALTYQGYLSAKTQARGVPIS